MLTAGSFKHYWLTNPEWYYYDDQHRPHLTDAATDLARESFKAYKKWVKRAAILKDFTSHIPEHTYWESEDSWYDIDDETGEYVLTPEAPQQARESFERWKEYQKRKKELAELLKKSAEDDS